MHGPASLKIVAFGPGDPLALLGKGRQVQYLRRYLDDLGAAVVVEEPQYFDRDYLAEFSAFYSTSAAGYSNVCRRLHFFAEPALDQQMLTDALAEKEDAAARLRKAYLGFVVIRPIPASPLGRTVVQWYPDGTLSTPRITEPSRYYKAHLAGFELSVRGLAWQQQDSAVGACATVALWSILHSSAFDEHHAIPTTAAITRAAHRTASLGDRVFPSAGLTVHQLCEAIKEHGLSPIIVPGDLGADGEKGFSRERFNASCSALIRSGYPVLIICDLENVGRHAVCAVGFRSSSPPSVGSGGLAHHDVDLPVIYVHDDNLGPNVRFRIGEDAAKTFVRLKAEAPTPVKPTTLPDPTIDYPAIIPRDLVIAVPDDLRTSPDALHRAGLTSANLISAVMSQVAKQQGVIVDGLTLSTRFIRLRDYLGAELGKLLGSSPDLLAKARLELCERVRPMSLHLGVIRIGAGAQPMVDVLYDTTDSDRNHPAFAYVVFAPGLGSFLEQICNTGLLSLGVRIEAC